MRGLSARLRVLFRREKFDAELEEEMDWDRRMIAQSEIEDGMAPEDASRRAAIQFGNRTLLRETSRDTWGWGPLERCLQDLRYAARILRNSPGFTMIAMLVLALGIGAGSTAYSLVRVLLMKPLPFPESDRIVYVDARHVSGQNSGAGYRDFLDWSEQNAVFEEMAIFPWASSYTLTAEGEPERVAAARTTHGFDRVLGLQPAIVRFFSAGEDRIGGPPVVLLSYAAWQKGYAGSLDVLGKTVTLDGVAHTIIGILPDRFALPGIRTSEFWLPLREDPAAGRLQHQYGVLARLKPGVSIERARSDMTAIARRLEQDYPRTNTGWGIAVTPALPGVLSIDERPLLVLSTAVLFVLLLACANIAGMLLARGTARAQEMTVRASLGAGRWRIMRQVLTESILLALGGGVLGIAFAAWLMGVTRRVAPADLALDASLRMDWHILLFALTLSVLTGLIFGLAPAWFAARANLASALKTGTARSGFGSRNRVLSALVTAEVALSMALLIAASLLTKDLALIVRTSIGIRVDHILTFALDLPLSKYPTEVNRPQFYQDLLARLRIVPGVEAAGAIDTLPMTGSFSGGPFQIEGRPKPADWMDTTSQYLACTRGYLRAMDIRFWQAAISTAATRPNRNLSRSSASRLPAATSPASILLASGSGIGIAGGPSLESLDRSSNSTARKPRIRRSTCRRRNPRMAVTGSSCERLGTLERQPGSPATLFTNSTATCLSSTLRLCGTSSSSQSNRNAWSFGASPRWPVLPCSSKRWYLWSHCMVSVAADLRNWRSDRCRSVIRGHSRYGHAQRASSCGVRRYRRIAARARRRQGLGLAPVRRQPPRSPDLRRRARFIACRRGISEFSPRAARGPARSRNGASLRIRFK
jgi:hypothetical protein